MMQQPLPKTVLIIDDDTRNIFALSAVIRAKGFQTVSAPGMGEAFTLLAQDKNIGIILLDMMMPDMDGYEALPKLKSSGDYGHLPVIAVTAQAMKGDRERCIEAGADDYLAKPVDVDKLLALLNEHLK
jgi:CheY-like chemotaxis protein